MGGGIGPTFDDVVDGLDGVLVGVGP